LYLLAEDAEARSTKQEGRSDENLQATMVNPYGCGNKKPRIGKKRFAE
jgi:hypothetical protein